LHDVEEVFAQVELVSFQERKCLHSGKTEITLKALPSGNSVGGTAWNIVYNHLAILYCIDLNDKETPISLPF
jgi:Cft2 family RNA processing exonuclease